jgi:hypothetical protein
MQLHEFLLNNRDLTIDQALGQFSFRTGYKTSTLKQWVDEFVMAGMIKIDKGFLL